MPVAAIVSQYHDGHFAAALAAAETTIAAGTSSAALYDVAAASAMALGQLAQAEIWWRQALALDPQSPGIRTNFGVLLLALGRYAEAWPYYDSRSEVPGNQDVSMPPQIPFPLWQGESLAGKSILVWREQGLGDELQFCRFIPELKRRGAQRITLACKQPLKRLLPSLAGVDAVVSSGDSIGHHDFRAYLLGLPRHLGITLDTLPAALPYLHPGAADILTWRPRLPAAPFRVGLVWRGSTLHKHDRHRSLPSLAALAPLWRAANVAFVSLQKGQGEDEALAPPSGQPLTHLGTMIQDFADSAAIVSQLDLVICVDTAIAHLAGALGKPCWLLLPAVSTDWRWQSERADSPWYPGVMRLFRQTDADDWSATINEVALALRQWTGTQSDA